LESILHRKRGGLSPNLDAPCSGCVAGGMGMRFMIAFRRLPHFPRMSAASGGRHRRRRAPGVDFTWEKGGNLAKSRHTRLRKRGWRYGIEVYDSLSPPATFPAGDPVALGGRLRRPRANRVDFTWEKGGNHVKSRRDRVRERGWRYGNAIYDILLPPATFPAAACSSWRPLSATAGCLESILHRKRGGTLAKSRRTMLRVCGWGYGNAVYDSLSPPATIPAGVCSFRRPLSATAGVQSRFYMGKGGKSRHISTRQGPGAWLAVCDCSL